MDKPSFSKALNRPPCFGKLQVVFPMAEEGLRATPESCLACRFKTECLRAAMKTAEGIQVRQEKLDRAYASGMVGFLERWSRKKWLQNQMTRETPRPATDPRKGEEDEKLT